MPERNSEIKELFNDMLSLFLEWDGVYKEDSIDRALLKTEANSLFRISKAIDKNIRSRFIVTAKGNDLDIIGEGMNRPRLAGETDVSYRKRLIVNDTFFNDTTLAGIKNALRGYYGIDVDNDTENDTKIIEIYKLAFEGSRELDVDTRFIGEKVKEGAIEVHLMMVENGDQAIISRVELFDKIYRTRAAGILLYLYWHGNFDDNIRKKLKDSTSLVSISTEAEVGDNGVVLNDDKCGMPILHRHDVIDIRTKGDIKNRKYNIILGTDHGVPKIKYEYNGATEENNSGKRFEDDITFGEMRSRRVHRLLNGEYFDLPKDFQTPLKFGQRKEVTLLNHENNVTKEVLRIESKNNIDIRVKIDNGTKGKKVIFQTVPKEYNVYDLVYFGDMILTDYLMSGTWYNIDTKKLIEDGAIACEYNELLDEYATTGYYISPPIHIDNIVKFGMIKWVYNTGNTKVCIRTGADEASLTGLGNEELWGSEYSINTGEFINENVNNFFQFKISLSGTIYESPIFRLSEFFIEYWDVSPSLIEEIYDNVLSGTDLINSIDNSLIGKSVITLPNINGNGGSNILLALDNCHWISNVKPVRQSRIRNRRWTLFYGVKTIITEYFSRDSIHQYSREVVCL